MALDFIARASAAAAQTTAIQALARTATLDLFTGLGSRSIDASINALSTGGYGAIGKGAGVYIADPLATAALAAAHPRFCKATANGRYFRLAGDYVHAAQAGATGLAGTDDRPALQAMLDYAAAVGIPEVRFLPFHETWHRPDPGGIPDGSFGYHLAITGNQALIGDRSGTTISCKGDGGVARTRFDGTFGWQAGGLFFTGTATTSIVIRNLKVDGGLTFANVYANAESNVWQKGLALWDNHLPNLVTIDIRDTEITGFAGELFYMGGSFATCEAYVENLTLHNSPQSAWNAGSLCKVTAVNLRAYDSYQSCEILGGTHTYIGGLFGRCYSSTIMGLSSYFGGGMPYWYPARDLSKEPPWITFEGTRFVNCYTLMCSFVRGSIVAVDCTIELGNFNTQDVDLVIEHWTDSFSGGTAVSLFGPPNTTTELVAGSGRYLTKPRNITLDIRLSRTQRAAANNWGSHALLVRQLIDKDTVRAKVSGAGDVITADRVAGFAMPLITYEGVQAFQGTYQSVTTAAPTAIDAITQAYRLSPDAAGQATVTMSNAYGYVDGQRIRLQLWDDGGGTKSIKLPQGGAGLNLAQDRILSRTGDFIDLEYTSSPVAGWYEIAYSSARAQVLAGSKTYDAPSVAAGGTTTTTVTVTGAVLGDYVDRISLGVSAAGLVMSGHVSAADTVTVVLSNPTAAAVDLASTTLSVEVKRKL